MAASVSLGLGFVSLLVSFLAQTSDGAPKLPGPGIDIPVDVNGDGEDSFGDRYFFNWWLEAGGDLDLAMSTAAADGKLIDLSTFFLSSDAQLVPQSPEAVGPSGGGAGL